MNLDKIIGLAVGGLVLAILLPLAITEILGANTTGWNDSVSTVWTVLLPVLMVIAAILYFMPKKK